MPIHIEFQPHRLTRDEYHDLDYQVMGLVFDMHRQLGRLHDERIYQAELAHRCVARGLKVAREARITVSLDGFVKPYAMDLVVEDAVDYELKTAEALVAAHRGQALNYLFLSDLRHGKLVNLRPSSVEHEFVTTQLTAKDRRQVRLETRSESAAGLCSRLAEVLRRIIAEWGGFLDTELYRDAITHFCGGVLRPVAVTSENRELGQAGLILLNEDTALEVSSLQRDHSQYAEQLRRKLICTPLRAFQWVNFDRHKVTIQEIK